MTTSVTDAPDDVLLVNDDGVRAPQEVHSELGVGALDCQATTFEEKTIDPLKKSSDGTRRIGDVIGFPVEESNNGRCLLSCDRQLTLVRDGRQKLDVRLGWLFAGTPNCDL